MAQIPETIQAIIADYINKVGSQIPIKKAVLFGSYANGTFKQDSDIDLAIFSEYFDKMASIDAFRFLFLQAMDYGVDLQPQAFTVENFENPMGIIEDILKSGIDVLKPETFGHDKPDCPSVRTIKKCCTDFYNNRPDS